MEKNIQDTVGQRLKRYRERKGKSQRNFADSLGITQSTLSRLETDAGGISTETIMKMVKVYNLNPNWILLGIKPIEFIGDEETDNKFLKDWKKQQNKLTPEEKEEPHNIVLLRTVLAMKEDLVRRNDARIAELKETIALMKEERARREKKEEAEGKE